MPDVNEPGTGRVLVLGGQGVLGTAIAGAFGAAGWTSVRAGGPTPAPISGSLTWTSPTLSSRRLTAST